MNARNGLHPAAELNAMLRENPIKPNDIAAFLDGLNHGERVAAIRSLRRREQRNLYESVDGFKPVGLEDLVPRAVVDFHTVIHYGKNSLPAFTHFEKRFFRPSSATGDGVGELYGFNFQRMAPITGPGYFTAREVSDRGEVLIDYSEIPSMSPDEWPPIRSNDRGVASLVFGSLVDRIRGVSNHVTIGSAARGGKDLGSWFVLCRDELYADQPPAALAE